MSWVQSQGPAPHPNGAHLAGVPSLALDVCIGWAGATEKPPAQPKQLQRRALPHAPCSTAGPSAPVSTLTGH